MESWRFSLHGGHSSAYCDHAYSPLEAMVEAAIAQGLHTFGITEHAPRPDPAHLYAEELDLGWTVETLAEKFEAYAGEVDRLRAQYAGRIRVLKGFEIEVPPVCSYAFSQELRARYAFDYIVGSVHWVNGHIIDYRPEHFDAAVAVAGGLEPLAIQYYAQVVEMVRALRPEVVGHFDLIRRNAPSEGSVDTPAIRAAAVAALEAVAETGGLLDINTGGYRKGLGRPYPARWIVRAARELGIGCCFGDDSHRVAEVGAGLEEARAYLLGCGVDKVVCFTDGGTTRESVSLLPLP